jgi:hypothetical protein
MSVTAVPIPPTRRGVLVTLWLGIAVAVALALWLAIVGAAPVVAEKGTNDQFLAYNRTRPGVMQTASGLQYEVLKKGEGDKSPTDSDVALIAYVGRLRDGTVFEAPQQPQPFPVSRGIKGFAEGLKLMRKGARYRFWMKPEIAYGNASPDPAKIPPGSLLVFDVQMLDFINEQQYQQIMMQRQLMQMQQQQPGAPAPNSPRAGN